MGNFKHFFTCYFILSVSFLCLAFPSRAQTDSFSTETNVVECGFTYSGSNTGFTAAGCDPKNTCADWCCVGSSSPTDIDCNCATDYEAVDICCSQTDDAGQDFEGSIENNMFWRFDPAESCDYQICVDAYNCSSGGPTSYMQLAIYQAIDDSLTDYLLMEPNNTAIGEGSGNNQGDSTVCFTVSVDTAKGDVVVMLDGNSGSECDVDLTVDTVAGTGCAKCNIAPPQLTVLVDSIHNVGCFGDSTGAIFTSVSGGNPPYDYSWSNGDTTQDINTLPADTYSVTVTDSASLNADTVFNIVVTEPDSLIASVDSVADVLCHGDTTGNIFINVNGGTSPYSYTWSDGSTDSTLSNVDTGAYTVTVTDQNGCTDTTSGTVGEPDTLIASIDSITDILCNGDTAGEIFIDVTGGVSPYNFNWSDGSTDSNLTNVQSGVYMVTVTDGNGCTDTVSGIITAPDTLVATVDSITHQLCFGDTTGEIFINVTGGVGAYSFNWSNGSTDSNLTNVVIGTYTVTVTDANNCTDTVSGTIAQPDSLIVTVDRIRDDLCRPGAVFINVTGGTWPYDFNWSDGSVDSNLTGVGAGTYIVTVTDTNGCVDTTSGTVNEPDSLIATVDSVTHVLCHNETTGEIFIKVTGGKMPFSYSWSDSSTDSNLVGVKAGSYTVTVTDDNGCSDTVSGTITQPDTLIAQLDSVTHVLCHDDTTGEIFINVTGGIPPYNFNWSDGSTDSNLTNVKAGTYTVTVTDGNNCIDTISGTINEPDSLVITVDSIAHILCESTGDIFIDVIGGAGPYSFTWSDASTDSNLTNVAGGTYSVTVQDGNGCTDTTSGTVQELDSLTVTIDSITHVLCNGDTTGEVFIDVTGGMMPYSYQWSNGATDSNITNLGAGTYQITVTENNNCTDTASAIVTQPNALSLTTGTENSTCDSADGKAWVSVTGGTPAYSYAWDDTAGQTTDTAFNVPAGNYTVTVTDTNGCMDTASVTVNDAGAPSITLDSSVNVLCSGDSTGALFISVTGGATPYRYSWSNGDTLQDVTGLPAGSYTVQVTDSLGCSRSANFSITEPPALTLDIDSVFDVQCGGDDDGAVYITVQGGVMPYNYNWTNGDSSEDATNLAGGNYSVTVMDSNGCVVTADTSITEPPALATGLTVTDESCAGGGDGRIDLTVNGGTPPFTYSWSNGDTTQDLNNLVPDTYRVVITDSNGCMIADTGIVTTTYVQALARPDTFICFGDSVQLQASGGVNYQWSPGTGLSNTNTPDPIATPTATTQYVVTVTTDSCSDKDSALIQVQPLPIVQADGDTNVIVEGSQVQVWALGAQFYNWTPGTSLSDSTQDTTVAFPEQTTTYYVIGTDTIGCTGADSITIKVIERETDTLFIPNAFTPNGDGKNDTWEISNIDAYPGNTVKIFNRWGDKLYEAKDYANDWGGMHNGKPLPHGVYFYVLDLNNGEAPLKGTITLIR